MLSWAHTSAIYGSELVDQNKQGLKRTLFNGTRQCNIQMFDKNIFVK